MERSSQPGRKVETKMTKKLSSHSLLGTHIHGVENLVHDVVTVCVFFSLPPDRTCLVKFPFVK